ncbi:peptide/nickel transport system permease protein [Microlunatus sagamiharensis]|uniref:Peptide/nickel transport system permease protein n=1 Tax=Microlunatus sagamiharensis TaxID=546874 RepID=A0A1H2MI91_9ACTN|nr:ABC transporter permease [Microlunatus sagamiharensis]SDU92963.1 peptide/nickel transport system permease protein [Microlunatus sagamiharensis]
MGFVLRRLGSAVPVVLGITLVAFLLIHAIPGDPASVILFGANASPAQIAALRTQLGLDRPLATQYVDFLGQLLHGDLGTSYLTSNSVAHELLSRAPSTIVLAVAAIAVAVVVGVPLGLAAGARPGTLVDQVARGISFLGVAVPYFFLALLLVLLLSVRLDWLPAIDDGTPAGLVLPAVSLGWGYAAILTRLVRGRIIEEYRSEYVRSARARGCGEWRVLLGHALRNSSIPAITTIGLQFGNILTGAAITEVIFGRAGLGSFLATSISNKNIPVVQGAIVVIGISYVLINLAVDLVVGAVDPRTRLAGAR